MQAAPGVKSRPIPTKPKGNCRCQAQKPCFDIPTVSLTSARSLPHCRRLLHTTLSKSNQFLVSGAMSRYRHGHRHFNKFLVNLGKCAASRCQVTLDSRERSDVSDDEHRAVNVASRASLTRGRVDTETLVQRCGPLAARCALSAKSVVLEIILSNRRVTVDSHGAGGGRN
jgi:hypothetical protein